MLVIFLFMVSFVYAYMISIDRAKSRWILLILSILTLICLTVSIVIHDTSYLNTKPNVTRYEIEPVSVSFDDSDDYCIVEKKNKNGTKNYFLNVYDETLENFVLTEIEDATYYRGFTYHMTKEENPHKYSFLFCFPWELKDIEKDTYTIYINNDTIVSSYIE